MTLKSHFANKIYIEINYNMKLTEGLNITLKLKFSVLKKTNVCNLVLFLSILCTESLISLKGPGN